MVPQIAAHSGVEVRVGHRARVHVRQHVERVRHGRLADGAMRVRCLVLGLSRIVRTSAAAVRAQYVGTDPAREVCQILAHSVPEGKLPKFVLEVYAWWQVMLFLVLSEHVQKLCDEYGSVAGNLNAAIVGLCCCGVHPTKTIVWAMLDKDDIAWAVHAISARTWAEHNRNV
jgi:hypothetical protein